MKYDKRELVLAIIGLIAVLEIDGTIGRWSQLIFTTALVSGITYLGTGYTLTTIRDSIKFTGWITYKGIEEGTKLLDNLELFKPGNRFMPSMPMMVCASAHGYRSVGQAGFSLTRDTGSGDDDGEGDADNNSDKVERNQPDHEGKSAWEKVLAKFSELSARLDVLEKGDTRECPRTEQHS